MYAIIKSREDRKAITDSLRKWINKDRENKASISAVNEAFAIACGAKSHQDLLNHIDNSLFDTLSTDDFGHLHDCLKSVIKDLFDHDHFDDHWTDIETELVKRHSIQPDGLKSLHQIVLHAGIMAHTTMGLSMSTQLIRENDKPMWSNFLQHTPGILMYGGITALNEAANVASRYIIPDHTEKPYYLSDEILHSLDELIDESIIFSCEASVDDYEDITTSLMAIGFEFLQQRGFYDPVYARNMILAAMIMNVKSEELVTLRHLVINEIQRTSENLDTSCDTCDKL